MTDGNNLITYNAVYGDGSFEKITLGKIINKGGAAGRIVEIEEHPQLVAKIFHSLADRKSVV